MPLLHVFYALLVVSVWGANFVASKFALEHFPPIFLTFLRFAILGALLLPFVPRPNKKQLQFLALLSTLGTLHFALPQASLATGLDIASCAVICQTGVAFSCLFSAIFLGDRLGVWRLSGLLISFAGVILVLGTPHVSDNLAGFFYALASALFFGIYNVLMKRYPEITVLQLLAWISVFMLPQLIALTFIFESPTWQMLTSATAISIGAIIFTVLFSTIIGHGLWYFLMKNHSVSKVAPFSLLVPITGTAFGQIFYNQPLSWQLLLGGAITLFGVAIIVIRRPKLKLSGESI